MNIKIILEHRFKRTPDGQVWTDMALPYSAWQPYFTTFSGVNIVARIQDVTEVSPDMKLTSGPGVQFSAVPYFVGPLHFLLRSHEVRQAMRTALSNQDAVLLRVPGTLGTVAYRLLRARRQPYGVQVVGDPNEVFAPGAVRHPLRTLFRWWFTRQLQTQCRHASTISYVTRTALQERYPSLAPFSNSFSNVQMPDSALVEQSRTDYQGLGSVQRPCRMVLVGSLAQMYKSPDVVLRALALCIGLGLHLHLTVVGDGRHRAEMELLARELGIHEQVTFAGQLSSGIAVRAELDRADLFVLPSRTEGLPRAMIEAMARGLPCIGSTVGGIPELLAPEDLVPPGDEKALADKLQEVLLSQERLREMSRRNLATSREYADTVLNQKRQAFYRHLADQTAQWLATRQKAIAR